MAIRLKVETLTETPGHTGAEAAETSEKVLLLPAFMLKNAHDAKRLLVQSKVTKKKHHALLFKLTSETSLILFEYMYNRLSHSKLFGYANMLA